MKEKLILVNPPGCAILQINGKTSETFASLFNNPRNDEFSQMILKGFMAQVKSSAGSGDLWEFFGSFRVITRWGNPATNFPRTTSYIFNLTEAVCGAGFIGPHPVPCASAAPAAKYCKRSF